MISPDACRWCYFPNPVGGLDRQGSGNGLCELCDGLPDWLDERQRDLSRVLNPGLNLIRRDIALLRAETHRLPSE